MHDGSLWALSDLPAPAEVALRGCRSLARALRATRGRSSDCPAPAVRCEGRYSRSLSCSGSWRWPRSLCRAARPSRRRVLSPPSPINRACGSRSRTPTSAVSRRARAPGRRSFPRPYFLTIRPSKSLKRVQFQVTEYVYYDCQPGDRWTEDPVNHESGTCRPPEGG